MARRHGPKETGGLRPDGYLGPDPPDWLEVRRSPAGGPAGSPAAWARRGSTTRSHPLLIVVGVNTASLLDGLTAAQRAAVVTDAAPLCILAGAGAGKTRALTRRIAYRVATGTADPGHVLALTFTRKAAGELGERLAALGMRDRIAAGTFHGIAFAQLRQWWADRGEAAPALLDRKGRLLVRLVAGRPGFDGIPVADLAAEIEWAQARLVSPATYEAAGAAAGRRPPVDPSAMAALFDRYVAEKRRRRLADFDDLLARCAAAIETDPGFGAAQRWRWRHLFVDEFQDANPLQYRLLLAWLGPRLDLCVVGDPNQAIYGWNGADPGLITGLAGRWPGTEVVRLEANHRCTPQVVDAAARALGLPPGSVCSTRPDGPPVSGRAYPSDDAEAHGVVTDLRRARAGGLAWSHLAVLMRTNAQAAAFEAACRAAGVPCRVAGATSLLDEPVVMAALADIRRRSGAPMALVIANLDQLAGAGPHPEVTGGDPVEARAGLEALAGMARDFQRLDTMASAAGFPAWLEATARAEHAERTATADSVTICTFHRAKGLEWPAVWVTGLERGLVPISYATTPASEAEERRLLYVALTRAATELHCSWAQQRRLGGRLVPREPSPWLDGIVAGPLGAGGEEAERSQPGSEATVAVWRRHFTAERERLASRHPGHRRTGRPRDVTGVAPIDRDPAVLDALTAWRTSAARAAGVPPYVLFHDATLAAVATSRPSTIDELLAVPGVGPVKASRYGPILLAVVARHRATA
jgi:DNA helicase-2/ATP-dependent DNA helicase PcrA